MGLNPSDRLSYPVLTALKSLTNKLRIKIITLCLKTEFKTIKWWAIGISVGRDYLVSSQSCICWNTPPYCSTPTPAWSWSGWTTLPGCSSRLPSTCTSRSTYSALHHDHVQGDLQLLCDLPPGLPHGIVQGDLQVQGGHNSPHQAAVRQIDWLGLYDQGGPGMAGDIFFHFKYKNPSRIFTLSSAAGGNLTSV